MDAGKMSQDRTDDRARWRALYVASILSGFLLLGIGDANVALPAISDALHIGPTSLQLVSAGYVVTFGLTLVPFGRLGDQGHRRRLIFIGLSVYVASSLVCGLAADWRTLIAGRVLLGVSAGILMPQTIGVIQQLFSGAERGRAFADYGVMTAIATALGPSVGGLLVTLGGQAQGWRWIFLMNVPIGVALFAAGLRYLPRTQPVAATANRSLDPFGAVLLGVTVLLVLYPLVLTTGLPGDSAARWYTLLPAAVFGVLFWRWERRYARRGSLPLLDGDLLRTRSYRIAMLVAASWLATGPAVSLVLMLYLQLALGLSPVLAALVLLPSAAASAFGARWAARRVLLRGRVITLTGLFMSAGGILVSALAANLLPPHPAIAVITVAQVLNGVGNGMVISPNHVLLLIDVPKEKGGLAASIGHLTQRIGNSLGVAATSAAFYAVIYGQAGGLTNARRSTYDSALTAGVVTAGIFFVLAVWASVVDLLRMRRARAVPPSAALATPLK
ncbi:MFS transporter [Streptosporangium saharense]|uniref:MFS transporter n=1 Tax=Streptosporangium saharense TaxID=1706840 RepID=UPI0036C58CB4